MPEQTVNYDFLKEFTESCTNLPNNGVGAKCLIIVASPFKTKKGTKNSPCPFYDRELITENENDRYTMTTVKMYDFIYGDRYEDHVEEGHVFESDTTADGEKKKEKPDPSVPMLSLNRTGKYCIDVVAPEKRGNTAYVIRNSDGRYELASPELVEQAKSWMPSKGSYQAPIFKQFAMENVVFVYNYETKQCFRNPNFQKEDVLNAGIRTANMLLENV